MESLFASIMTNGTITGASFIIATLCSLALGCFIAFMYAVKNDYSKSYIITLALLPAIVQIVIMLVNGNLGTGIAVAGAFSLVRFRSAPGSGKEITSIFLAMAAGLATGIGYVGIAILFTVVISAINVLMKLSGMGRMDEKHRMLKITIPENLDFEGRFEDIFHQYLEQYTYDEIKTSDMGSLYKMTLSVHLKSGVSTKKFLDELRTRNGNLEISLSRAVEGAESL